jgi:hypothetical protein
VIGSVWALVERLSEEEWLELVGNGFQVYLNNFNFEGLFGVWAEWLGW